MRVYFREWLQFPCIRISGYSLHPRFFDEQLGSAVGAINYVRGSENGPFTSILL